MTEQERFFFDHGYAHAKREFDKAIKNIKTEILSYKDDKIIHEEVNEMTDIVVEIIDRHLGGEEQNDTSDIRR